MYGISTVEVAVVNNGRHVGTHFVPEETQS